MDENTIDHRAIAIATYNACWDLIDAGDLSAEDRAQLLTLALTSRYHWFAVGDEQAEVIAEWMASRAAVEFGDGPLAVAFADRAVARVDASAHAAWLRGSVYEGLARARHAAGDASGRDAAIAQAEAELALETDDEDREFIADQLASVPRT